MAGNLIKLSTLIYLSLGALYACGGGGSSSQNEDESNAGSAQISQAVQIDPLADDNILERIYSNKRIPNGFYREPSRDNTNFYTIDHVKNTDINKLSNEAGSSVNFYELCSDHFNEALLWSEEDSDSLLQYMDLVDNSENALFYEFIRVNLNTPNNIRLNRVFKCSFIDRSNSTQQQLGILPSPNASKLKQAVEYLWTLSINNNYGHAVLSSLGSTDNNTLRHTLRQAHLLPAQENEVCDRIEVWQTDYNVSLADGQIHRVETLLKTLYAKNDSGSYHICEI